MAPRRIRLKTKFCWFHCRETLLTLSRDPQNKIVLPYAKTTLLVPGYHSARWKKIVLYTVHAPFWMKHTLAMYQVKKDVTKNHHVSFTLDSIKDLRSRSCVTVVVLHIVSNQVNIWTVICGVFKSPKKWTFFVRISALASKKGQINKILLY